MPLINSFEIKVTLESVVNGGSSTSSFDYGLAIVSYNGKTLEFYVDTKPAHLNLADLENGKTYILQGELRPGETPACSRFAPVPVVLEFKEPYQGDING